MTRKLILALCLAALAACKTAPKETTPEPPAPVEAPAPPTVTRGEFLIEADKNDTWNAVGQLAVRTPGVTYEGRSQMMDIYSLKYRGQEFMVQTKAMLLSDTIRNTTTRVTATTKDGKPIDNDAVAELLAMFQRDLPAEIKRVQAEFAAKAKAEKEAKAKKQKAKKKKRSDGGWRRAISAETIASFPGLLCRAGHRMRAGWSAWARLACLAGTVGLLGVCTFGVATRIVDATLLGLTGVYGVLAVAVGACAWAMGCMTPWSPATRVAAVWFAAFVWFVGAWPVVAVATLAMAALALGSVCVRGARPAATTVLVGLVLIGCFAGWVVTWPVHLAPVWWTVFAGLAWWRWRIVVRVARASAAHWRRVVLRTPRMSCLAVLVVGLASTACWLPNLQADDLAHHLRLPTELLHAGAYAPDARRSVWAYAPWLNDTLHGIVAVVGGGVAHGALNGLWLALVGCLAWRAMTLLGASPVVRFAGVLLVASIPLVGGLATGMHTELPATALMLALCIAAFERRRAVGVATVAALGAGLLALKLMHVAAALPLIAYALARHARGTEWREGILAGVVVLSGLSAYAHAALATGNPVLPLANGVFRSEFAALANFNDPRWTEGLSLALPFQLVFDTTRYLESGRGALGVAPVAFAAVIATGLADRRVRVALLLAIAAVVIPYCIVPYARYLLPGLACACVVALAAAERLLGRGDALRLGLACALLQVALLPSGNWLLSTSALARHVAAMGHPARTTHRFLPERGVLEMLPATPGVVIATHPDAPWTAWLGKHGVAVGWYAPTLQRAASEADIDPAGHAWRALFEQVDARWALVDRRHASTGLLAALAADGAILHAQLQHAEVWELARRGERDRIIR